MKIFRYFLPLALTAAAAAAPLTNTAKLVIPKDVQQVIVVDYRTFNNSPAAMSLKEKVMPTALKQFEDALKASGVSPEKDVDQLVFASYRVKDGIRFVGLAQGQFPGQKLMARLKKQKTKPEKYRGSSIYPMGNAMSMVLLDGYNMVFGDKNAVRQALDVQAGEGGGNLSSNTTFTDMMSSVENDAVWSVLDGQGTQYMLKSALGDVADLADYNVIKNRLKGSRYKVDFASGVEFNLDVITSDNFTAATLASLAKAGMMFRKSAASTEAEKQVFENMKVSSDSNNLKLGFKTDQQKFQALLNTDLFKAVSK